MLQGDKYQMERCKMPMGMTSYTTVHHYLTTSPLTQLCTHRAKYEATHAYSPCTTMCMYIQTTEAKEARKEDAKLENPAALMTVQAKEERTR